MSLFPQVQSHPLPARACSAPDTKSLRQDTLVKIFCFCEAEWMHLGDSVSLSQETLSCLNHVKVLEALTSPRSTRTEHGNTHTELSRPLLSHAPHILICTPAPRHTVPNPLSRALPPLSGPVERLTSALGCRGLPQHTHTPTHTPLSVGSLMLKGTSSYVGGLTLHEGLWTAHWSRQWIAPKLGATAVPLCDLFLRGARAGA